MLQARGERGRPEVYDRCPRVDTCGRFRAKMTHFMTFARGSHCTCTSPLRGAVAWRLGTRVRGII